MNREGVPDLLAYHLKVLFVGYNPSLRSAEVGHHYAGRNNKFWDLLYRSGLTSRRLQPEEDREMLDMGYGMTNIVSRPTRTAAELTPQEYREGGNRLRQVIAHYRPRFVCYEGIGVYKALTGKKQVTCGLQDTQVVSGVKDFVVPSPSGLTRIIFADQLVYYQELKRLLEREG